MADLVNRNVVGLGKVVDTSKVKPYPNPDCTASLLAAINDGIANGGEVRLPPGIFYVDGIELNNIKGLILTGSGKLATQIISKATNVPALRVLGMWYSTISDIGFGTKVRMTNDMGVVDIDAGSVHGTQGNSFRDCSFYGRGGNDALYSNYAFTLNRISGSSGQGSENSFLNCHFTGANNALYRQHGYNALQNTFQGCNFQSYNTHGLELVLGNVHLYSCGFQATSAYTQVLNGGYDVYSMAGGAYEPIILDGCRTESLQFAKNNFGQSMVIRGCQQIGTSGLANWTANTAYTVGIPVSLAVAATATRAAGNLLYVCAVANSDAVFTPAKWTFIDNKVVDIVNGSVTNCEWWTGRPYVGHVLNEQIPVVTSDYMMRLGKDTGACANALSGPLIVRIYPPDQVPEGQEVTIKRIGNSAHEAIVMTTTSIGQVSNTFNADGVNPRIVLNKANPSVTLKMIGTPQQVVPPAWHIIAGAVPNATKRITADVTAAGWNAGWISSNSFAGDGYVEYYYNQADSYAIMGLIDQTSFSATSYTDLDIAVAYAGFNSIVIYEPSAPSGYSVVSGVNIHFLNGIVKLSRTGTTLKVYLDNTLVYTSPYASTGTLRAGVAFPDSNNRYLDCLRVNGEVPATLLAQNVIVTDPLA